MNNNIHSDLMRGNIETVILKCLFEGDKYGYDICKDIEERTHGQYKMKQPTLYGCLTRLENQGLVSFYWGESTNKGGRRKYFSLTEAGRNYFTKKQTEWEYSRTVIDKLISENQYDLSTLPPKPDEEKLKKTSAKTAVESETNEDNSFSEISEEFDNELKTETAKSDNTKDNPTDKISDSILNNTTENILNETVENDVTETSEEENIRDDSDDILSKMLKNTLIDDGLSTETQDETTQTDDNGIFNIYLDNEEQSSDKLTGNSNGQAEDSNSDTDIPYSDISEILSRYDTILSESTLNPNSNGNITGDFSDINENKYNDFSQNRYTGNAVKLEDLEQKPLTNGHNDTSYLRTEEKLESQNYFSDFIGKILDESDFFKQNNYSSSIKNQTHISKENKYTESVLNTLEAVSEEETALFNEQLSGKDISDNDYVYDNELFEAKPESEDKPYVFFKPSIIKDEKRETAQSIYNLKTDPSEFMYTEDKKEKAPDYKNIFSKFLKLPAENTPPSNIALESFISNVKKQDEPVIRYANTKARTSEPQVDETENESETSYKVRKHSKLAAKEFNSKYYIYINKLRLWQFLIIAISSLVFVGLTFLIMYLGLNIKEDASLYILMGVGGVFLVPIVSLALYFQNPNQTKRVGNEFASPSVIFIVIVFLVAVIICLNVIVTPNIFKNYEHITRIILPSLMCLNIVVAEISYRFLRNSNKFNYVNN